MRKNFKILSNTVCNPSNCGGRLRIQCALKLQYNMAGKNIPTFHFQNSLYLILGTGNNENMLIQ